MTGRAMPIAAAVSVAVLVMSLPPLAAQQRTVQPSKFTRAPMTQAPAPPEATAKV